MMAPSYSLVPGLGYDAGIGGRHPSHGFGRTQDGWLDT